MGKKPSTFMKPMKVSAVLAAVVGKGPISRTEMIKKLWEYIKSRKLQDPKDKRKILPDEALAKVFENGKEAVDMFEMTKQVNKHLS